MKNFEQFKKDFKRDLLIQIVINMRHGKTGKASSSELAREVLKIFREGQAKQVFERINKLAETHPEILDIFIKRGYEFDSREKDQRLEQINIYLTKGGDN
jgi:hypothetical protein